MVYLAELQVRFKTVIIYVQSVHHVHGQTLDDDATDW